MKIITQHVMKNKVVEEYLVKKDTFNSTTRKTWDIDNYFKRQVKIILENSGYIDPENIDEYIEVDGYKALEKALNMTADEIIDVYWKAGQRYSDPMK